MQTEQITLELGEEQTLSIPKKNRVEAWEEHYCRWHTTGGAAIAQSDLEDDKTLKIVGASIGKTLISYGPDKSEAMTGEEKFTGATRRDLKNMKWEVTVVAKKDEKAAVPDSPLASSSQYDGLLPMNERQEEPSEKTPYGSDQNDLPVAPTPSMSDTEGSNVARQSEDAEIGDTAEEASRSAKKSTSKSTKKSKK